MANVIFASHNDACAAFMAQPCARTIEYSRQSIERFAEAAAPAAQATINHMRQTFHSVTQGETFRRIQALSNQIQSVWVEDGIRHLADIDSLQTAPQGMIRGIMANPTIRGMFHDNRCEGYGDKYVDAQPNFTGAHHYDYRRVMDGCVHSVEDSNGDITKWITHYTDLSREEELLLTPLEKMAIVRTWDTLEKAVETDLRDPTSVWNALLS